MQEDHDLANDLLVRPGVGYASGAHRTNTGHLTKPIRLGLDDIEHLLPERLHHLLGVDWANPANHSGAEVLLDTVDGGRGGRAHEARPELLAMGVIVNPVARGSDPFSGSDRGGVADDRDQIAVSTRFDPENAEAILSVVERDTFHKTRQDFLR